MWFFDDQSIRGVKTPLNHWNNNCFTFYCDELGTGYWRIYCRHAGDAVNFFPHKLLSNVTNRGRLVCDTLTAIVTTIYTRPCPLTHIYVYTSPSPTHYTPAGWLSLSIKPPTNQPTNQPTNRPTTGTSSSHAPCQRRKKLPTSQKPNESCGLQQ